MPRTITPEHQVRLALQSSQEQVASLMRENAALRRELLLRDLAAAYGDGVQIRPDGTIVEPAAPPVEAPPLPPMSPGVAAIADALAAKAAAET